MSIIWGVPLANARRLVRPVILIALMAPVGPVARAAEEPARPQQPLAHATLAMADGPAPAHRRVVFRARWRRRADAPIPDPASAGATVRVAGSRPGDGDSGVVALPADGWGFTDRRGGVVYRYRKRPAPDGIRAVDVRLGRRIGAIAISGGHAAWSYAITQPQGAVTVTVTVGTTRLCAMFRPRFAINRRGRLVARHAARAAVCPCERFASTFAALEEAVFARQGCNAAPCHGAGEAGGLDLRAGRAYANLVDVPARLAPEQLRVTPGDPTHSFLWRKLAKAADQIPDVPGTPMPSGGAPIPSGQLEALRLWIRSGAPATGVVEGTESLLGACLPPPAPIRIRAPKPPPADAGVQLFGPPWRVPPSGESEVCYATYYDLSATIPASATLPCPPEWGGAGARCFGYDATELTQDPNSHHGIVRAYRGAYALDDPAARFGAFACRGGAQEGLACNPYGVGTPAPAGAECGDESACASEPVPAALCIGFGPPDFSADPTGRSLNFNASPAVVTATTTVARERYPDGVYAVLPVKGVIVWNSHAFNVTAEPGVNRRWLNLYFAPPEARRLALRGLPVANQLGVVNVPPFRSAEYCSTYVVPRGARLVRFTTHFHKRGKLFRVWGPGVAADCDSATGPCLPEKTPPLLTTTDYADPAEHVFDPPELLDAADAATRRIKFCALYDNGASAPGTVKRRSTSPRPPPPLAIGGPCGDDTVACLAGLRRGKPCGGDDRRCDSDPAHRDGECDACPLLGGVTTEDEMLLFLGTYYQDP